MDQDSSGVLKMETGMTPESLWGGGLIGGLAHIIWTEDMT